MPSPRDASGVAPGGFRAARTTADAHFFAFFFFVAIFGAVPLIVFVLRFVVVVFFFATMTNLRRE